MPHLMNRKLITIFIGLFWTSNLYGQIQNDVKKVLASLDFVEFKMYADNLSNGNNSLSSHWESLRDLTSDFQEGVFFFEKSVPDKENPAISSVYTFRVTLVATKTTIVYFELSEEKNKKVGNEWKPYFDPIEIFKDEKSFDNLKASFKSVFNSELNESGLFVTDFVYGEACGFVGTDPIGRQKINEWVLEKDKNKLLRWLTSTNTEKQVYAVDGLLQLKKEGGLMTDYEIKIINFIIHKKGTMFFCSGDSYWYQDITEVTKYLKQ